MGWLLYRGLGTLLLIVSAPYFLIRRARHYLTTLGGRLGRYELVEPTERLWIHAVSVGEVGVAGTLIRELPDSIPIVVTTVTATGREVARRTLGDRVDVAVLPFDLAGPLGRFFARFRPRALVLVEGDYWPLMLREARRRGIPVAVVNGRVSDTGFRRLKKIRRWLHLLYGPISSFGVQTDQDRERLVVLGVERGRIEVTGNLKFDSHEPPRLPDLEYALRQLGGDRPILVAGSTMPGEEDMVLDALERVGAPSALLVVAPRHPERADEVAALALRRGFRVVRRSELDVPPPREELVNVCLLDTLGELPSLYRVALGVFIGGTLVPTGGHNPLEPARFSVPVVAGPSMYNFDEIGTLLGRHDAWVRATDSGAVATVWRSWIDDPSSASAIGARAKDVLDLNRGATAKSLVLIQPLVDTLHGP
ncbi:MAG: 3-deoxy-D-manno-octulosonic acid transferase [Acidobacteriota bacterium]|nr:3-deoxy-D-manno-octulosonic acid transferase [Acidobacteriota bacterium]